MVNKEPFYDRGVLMIDDIYLMTMSVSPIGAQKMSDVFNQEINGVPFAKQWLVDPDACKKPLKKDRDMHKFLALSLGYGLGPKKMVRQCYDKGHIMEFKTAKAFHSAYWNLFSNVQRLSQKLANQIKSKGYSVNPFGYRLTPPPHKAFNFMIQSSVSGIMHIFCAKLFAAAPWAKFITVIHDEVLVDVPIERLEEFRRCKEMATDSLNEDLDWSVKIRTGFVAGENWYEAK
jgi:DNA polymerase I-like protein with 3'-5' exonuclease and polymerase domains